VVRIHPRLPVSCPRSPTAETTVSEAVQCRCNSCRGHHFRLCSSVERVADYESAGRRCKSCRRHHFNAPVAQCTERRASNAEVGGESPSGSAPFQTRNVNRTSEPGLGANEIVPPSRGMRSMSSAFRHFHKAHECKGSSRIAGHQVLQICPSGCESRRGCHFKSSCSPTAEARRRERRQCRCNWLALQPTQTGFALTVALSRMAFLP
jgi:hypothetical protein